ncbi:autoinducer binding domain-containing protein [Gymnodinialimonas sp.]
MEDFQAMLDRISNAQSRRQLWETLLEQMHEFGIKMVSYHTTGSDGLPLSIASDGFPESWVCQYIDENLVQIDPIPELAARLSRPFFWHEIEELAPSTADTERYLALMANANIGDGIALYVFGPGLQNAYVGLGFGKEFVELDPSDLLRIQSIAQAGHLKFCEIQSEKTPRPSLTKRESEILEWVAQGKSNSVIADILSISQHTVDAHMRKIYAKLGVADRTSAALRSVGSAVIKLS